MSNKDEEEADLDRELLDANEEGKPIDSLKPPMVLKPSPREKMRKLKA